MSSVGCVTLQEIVIVYHTCTTLGTYVDVAKIVKGHEHTVSNHV